MKTSVIEIHDMLSVLSVDGVERRIGEVPGVEPNLLTREDDPHLDLLVERLRWVDQHPHAQVASRVFPEVDRLCAAIAPDDGGLAVADGELVDDATSAHGVYAE